MARFTWIFIVGMSITASASTIREKTVEAIDSTRIFPTVLRELIVGYLDGSKLVPRKPLKVSAFPILTLQNVGRYVACGNSTGDIHLLDVEKGEIIYTFNHHVQKITALAQLSGNRFASGSMDGTVCIRDIETKEQMHTLRPYFGGITSLAVHDDNLLVVSTQHGFPHLYEIDIGKCLQRLDTHDAIGALCPFKPGELLVGDRFGDILSWTTHNLLNPHQEDPPVKIKTTCKKCILALSASPRGKLAISFQEMGGVIKLEIWDGTTNRYLRTVKMKYVTSGTTINITTGAAWLPDERLILLGLDNQIGIHEVSTGEQLQRIKLNDPYDNNPLRAVTGAPKALTVINDHVVASNSSGELVILDSVFDILDS